MVENSCLKFIVISLSHKVAISAPFIGGSFGRHRYSNRIAPLSIGDIPERTLKGWRIDREWLPYGSRVDKDYTKGI